MQSRLASLACFLFSVFAGPGLADEINLTPNLDTSIYEESGDHANAEGIYLFSGATAGRNAGDARRALLSFDIAGSLPAGSTVTSASLSLSVNKVPSGAVTSEFGLFPLTQAWLEGTTDGPGQEGRGDQVDEGVPDATWTSTGFAEWQTPGGDFLETASSAIEIGPRGTYVWPSTESMVSNVQSWLDQPESNFGWILIGDEEPERTAKRFASSENTDESSRPMLTLEFTSDAPSVFGDFDGDGELLAADIDLLCDAITDGGAPADRDLNGDGMIDIADYNFWVEEIKGTFLGDNDLNGIVEFADFIVLSSQFGRSPTEPPTDPADRIGWAGADYNCSQTVDFADFLLVAENFGRVREEGTMASVPEPSAWALAVCLFGIGVVFDRRARR